MPVLFLCYPRCTTCKRAALWLDENNVSYEFRDIKENNPTYEELKSWHKISRMELRKFFNTSGLVYKSLELKDKLSSMSETGQLNLLSTDGMLVKRPLLIGEDFVLVGFNASVWSKTLFGI